MNDPSPGIASSPVASNPVIDRIRTVGKIEAVSFLLLLGVAMPLKYLVGIPMAVKIVGWGHGVLFMALCGLLLHAVSAAALSLRTAAMAFVAALLPFGPFVIDQRLRATSQSQSPIE